MLEMSKMTRKGKTVTANKWLAFPAYVSARDLATERGGEIGTTAAKCFTAKFDSVATAKAFVSAWTSEYERACEARLLEPASKNSNVWYSKSILEDWAGSTPVDAPAPAPAPAPEKPARKGKGNGKAVDFSKIKGNTKSDRNKAAHAYIVGMGIASGSEEYNALWKQWQSVR